MCSTNDLDRHASWSGPNRRRLPDRGDRAESRNARTQQTTGTIGLFAKSMTSPSNQRSLAAGNFIPAARLNTRFGHRLVLEDPSKVGDEYIKSEASAEAGQDFDTRAQVRETGWIPVSLISI